METLYGFPQFNASPLLFWGVAGVLALLILIVALWDKKENEETYSGICFT
jgi:hypothetical protein